MLMHHKKKHASTHKKTHTGKKAGHKKTAHKKKSHVTKKTTHKKKPHATKKTGHKKAGHGHKHVTKRPKHTCECGGTRRKRKHGGKKRPITPFLAYMQMRRDALMKENPNRPFGAYAKVAGGEWSKMSDEEKAVTGKKALAWYKNRKKSRGKK